MTLNQKLSSITIAIMPILTIATVFLPATTANAEITNKLINNNKIVQAAAPTFIGKTWEGKNKLRVQFYQNNNTYNGKIVSLPAGTQTKDVKNPDPKLRSRNLIGSVMFQGFTYDPAKKQLTGGVVYIPEMGKIMKPKLSIVSDDRIDMTISMGIMSRTVSLTAVK